ncbi:MAG: FtsW/RodA/SpoVE family cell cycle protein [Pseudobutyrivibrio sp.]|nr:FtsW/RodA/SpoVE family cell cycle protein [Pseudobutyrivibrio sp.]
MYLILINGAFVLYLNSSDDRILFMTIALALLLIIARYIFNAIIEGSNQSILNNLCLFLTISFLELLRLDFEKAARQLIFAYISLIIALIAVLILKQIKVLKDLWHVYSLLGILLLFSVSLLGKTEYGAKLSISIGSISLQPAEFVKLSFVFFIAAVLYKSNSFKNVMLVTVLAAIHVLILVASKDLGTAFVFLITYIVMLFIATGNYFYLLITLSGSAMAGFLALKLFPHIQTRFLAWKDPLSVVDDQGYQISQSLFAIGTGGWLGTGIYQGSPLKIPVVSKDFIFAAISEEMGGFFALLLIFVCISTFLNIFKVAVSIKDRFFRLVTTGFGTVYVAQSFLNIGGVIKFIPSTGVTLPFISYGGSSLLSCTIMFAIILSAFSITGQNIYDRKENNEKKHKSDFEEHYRVPVKEL